MSDDVSSEEADDVVTDDVDRAAETGSTVRRPTPAAAAASRARRIGGATGTRQVLSPTPEPAVEPVTEPVDAGASRWRRKATSEPAVAGAGGETVSTHKTEPRGTSARELKAEADTGPGQVAEVPQWLRWAPAVVLSACAITMIVIIAIAAHGVWYAKPSAAAERDKVLAAAKNCMAATNTYNYKTLAADEKRGLACTTGAWTAQYKSALEKIVKPSATQLKASQTVKINAAGVESVADDGHQWTTIVYGQLTINQSGAAARIDPFAAVVRMDKVKSSYLVSKIDLITNPTA